LTPEDKQSAGVSPKRSSEEIDVVAYSGRKNLLQVVECKSWIHSRGVTLAAFDGAGVPFNKKDGQHFQLFNKPKLREIVFARLREQFVASGACRSNANIKLCLASAHIVDGHRNELRQHFAEKGWELWDEAWLEEQLKLMSERGYENQVSAVVAKLLLRGKAK
jgi:hypothetical protein